MALIDIVMPVKNGISTLVPSVESMLEQSLGDIRLIVVDDGSTDGTREIIDRFRERDRRVVPATSPGIGIVAALNHGISLSDAPFIARMDADDLSVRTRLELQHAFIQDRPELAAVGSRVCLFGAKTGCPTMMLTPEECRNAMGLFCPVSHPTILIRRKSLDRLGQYYSEEFPYAEDYEIFSRLIEVGDLSNINQPLLYYRLHPDQISQRKMEIQRRSTYGVSARYLSAKYGVPESDGARIVMCMGRKSLSLGIRHLRQSARAIKNALKVMNSTPAKLMPEVQY